MSDKIDLAYAMRVAAGEATAASPMQEAQVLATLFDERSNAAMRDEKVGGFTHWQIRDAIEDMLRAQDHTPLYRAHIEIIGEHLAGMHDGRAGESDLMAHLAHWGKISERQKLHACAMFVDYMGALFRERFPGDGFTPTMRPVHVNPWEENEDTGEMKFSARRTYAEPDKRDSDHYFINVNTHDSAGFRSAATTMGDIFAAGIKAYTLHTARVYNAHGGRNTPADIAEDAERLAVFQLHKVFQRAWMFEDDVLFAERLPKAQAELLGERLTALIAQHRHTAPVPPPLPPATVFGWIGQALGLRQG